MFKPQRTVCIYFYFDMLTSAGPRPLVPQWLGASQGNSSSGRMGFVHFSLRVVLEKRLERRVCPVSCINLFSNFMTICSIDFEVSNLIFYPKGGPTGKVIGSSGAV